MNGNTFLSIIGSLLQTDIMTDEDGNSFVSEKIYSPLESIEYRYKERDSEKILVEIHGTNIKSREVSFREFLWNRLNLESIQRKYQIQYDQWKDWNEGVDYVPVQVICDDEPGIKFHNSNEFINSFCLSDKENNIYDGTSLMLAEYGMGKSSFCLSICKMAADKKGWLKGDSDYISLKDAFCNENAAFPLVFNLNNCRNDDFDEYIQNRLFSQYNLSLNFEAYQKLCQNGYFCTILDAWDQMYHTPYASQVEKTAVYINKLCDKKGKVLITCRRSFYQKLLKLKNAKRKDSTFKTVQNAKLYTLGGFNQESALEYLRKASVTTTEIPSEELDDDWIQGCWELNSELLEKPLNVRLLAGHFKTVMEKHDLRVKRVQTYDFLEVILEKWNADIGSSTNTKDGFDALKKLVFLTLSSGLNRGIDIDHFKEQICDKLEPERVLGAFRKLDFLAFQEEHKLIEFRLAAFQEFLWARYVLQELAGKKLLDKEALLNAYMLTLEVRAWVTAELEKEKNDSLYVQMKGDGKNSLGLKYKDKAEIGYCASNVLTLYRDLYRDFKNTEKYYHNEFQEIKKDLRHYCFEEADLRGLDLSGASFDYSDLAKADFSYTVLENTSFRAADLSETIWDEFGSIKKCAFIEESSVEQNSENRGLSVAAATESDTGTVLTYNILQTNVNIMNLGDAMINAIAADTEGVYTASQNGWVGYIEASTGDLKNAYITTSGLESIAPVGHASVYVGADKNGLFRYNWRSGVKQEISIDGNVNDISNVIYCKLNGERYISFISGESRKEIYILKMVGSVQATVVVHGKLKEPGFYFDDICFAENELVLAVAGKGVFSIDLSDFNNLDELVELDDKDICNDDNCIYPYRKNAVLDWAETALQLFVLEKNNQKLKSVTCIPWRDKREPEQWDLEYFCRCVLFSCFRRETGCI